MSAQGLSSPSHLRVDGGMVNNNWFVQNLSDITDIPIDRPVTVETTALGLPILPDCSRVYARRYYREMATR